MNDAILSPRFRLSLRSAIGATIALLIALAWEWPLPYWPALMVIVIMNPSLKAEVRLFPVRLLGLAAGAFAGFLTVAFFGQDRIPFLVASSAVFFVIGVGVQAPTMGPIFRMAGIAFPAVSLFGYADFNSVALLAFYRFTEAAFGLLVFTISHLILWPGTGDPVGTPPVPRPAPEPTLLGLPLLRWLSGVRLAIGSVIALVFWFELRPPGNYAGTVIACLLMAVSSALPCPRILYALAGMLCGVAAAFCVAYLGWAALPLGPETLFLTVMPVLFLFAFVQSAGPPYAMFGIYGSILFLVGMGLSNAQVFNIQTFFSRNLGLLMGGVIAALVLGIFNPRGHKESAVNPFF